MQWGSGEGSHSSTQGYNTWEFIYPTPYTTSVLSLSITGTGQTTELGTNYCNTVTLSSVLVASHDKGYVIIIGIQQWGIVEHIKQETRVTATFPTHFTQNNFAVLPVIFGWESVSDTISAYCISKTLTEAVLIADAGKGITSTNYANILYAAIGQ